jgi:hypothetical protein
VIAFAHCTCTCTVPVHVLCALCSCYM